MRRSTLTLSLALSALLMFPACATIGPPLPPSLELPKPPSDLRAVRKGDHVTLSWTIPTATTDRQTLRSLGTTRICRGLETALSQCGTPAGEADPQPRTGATPSPKGKAAGSYTDSLSGQTHDADSPGFITYAVEVLNAGGRGAGLSNQVRVSLARSLPPPQDFAARVTGQGVLLTWTNNAPPTDSAQHTHYVYRIFRNPESNQNQILAGEVPAGGDHTLTFTDSSIEWETTYEYRVETVTVIGGNKLDVQIEGDNSPDVKVFAHDVFPPAIPSGLQAVFSGPGQKTFIDLVWAPVTDVDLDGYNVYRHEDGSAAQKIKVNAEPVKTPAYRDTSVISGKTYVYSVSSIDVRGNESTQSEAASESVP
jgi:hypothetical protein